MEGVQEINNNLELLKIWLPSLVSIFTLILNLIFYFCIQPKQGYKYTIKNHLLDVSNEFFLYLANIVSLDDFSGVPTKVRQYSLKIHLCFKNGTANKDITDQLEKIFQMVKKRKTMAEGDEISRWNDTFRDEVRVLRKQLGKYCGGL